MTPISPTALVVTRLQDRGRRVGRGMAQCPAHDDHEPSLHITTGDDGRVLLRCHAGCSLTAVLDALDLAERDLFATPRARSCSNPERLPPSRQVGVGVGVGKDFPIGTGDTATERAGWIGELLEDWRRGDLEPIDVPLRVDRLAPQATTLRAIAEKFALVAGLCVAVGAAGPVAFTTDTCCRLMGWDPRRRKLNASTAIHALERANVIRWVKDLEPVGRGNGARCFLPCDVDLEALLLAESAPGEVAPTTGLEPLDGGEVVEERVGLDPPIERGEQLPVEHAVGAAVAPRRAVGEVARLDGAGTTLGHGQDDNDVFGASGAQTQLHLGPDPEAVAERERRVQELLREHGEERS